MYEIFTSAKKKLHVKLLTDIQNLKNINEI